jgi:hypothetical protein
MQKYRSIPLFRKGLIDRVGVEEKIVNTVLFKK